MMKSSRLPAQKSSVLSACKSSVYHDTSPEPTPRMSATSTRLCGRLMCQNSRMKAMEGCTMEMELVTAASDNSPKNSVPNRRPPGMLANTCGSTLKPSPKVLAPAAAATPSSETVAGTIMPTSTTSLAALAVSEERAISRRRPT